MKQGFIIFLCFYSWKEFLKNISEYLYINLSFRVQIQRLQAERGHLNLLFWNGNLSNTKRGTGCKQLSSPVDSRELIRNAETTELKEHNNLTKTPGSTWRKIIMQTQVRHIRDKQQDTSHAWGLSHPEKWRMLVLIITVGFLEKIRNFVYCESNYVVVLGVCFWWLYFSYASAKWRTIFSIIKWELKHTHNIYNEFLVYYLTYLRIPNP